MCTHRIDIAAHFLLARRASTRLGAIDPVTTTEADAAVDAIASRVRAHIAHGTHAARAAARGAIGALRPCSVDANRPASFRTMLPDGVAICGTGHELACALVLLEAVRRAGAHARIVSNGRAVALLVGDAQGWSAVLPRLGDLDWVPAPIGSVLDDSWSVRCGHETLRMLLASLAPVLEPEQLPTALDLVDSLSLPAA